MPGQKQIKGDIGVEASNDASAKGLLSLDNAQLRFPSYRPSRPWISPSEAQEKIRSWLLQAEYSRVKRDGTFVRNVPANYTSIELSESESITATPVYFYTNIDALIKGCYGNGMFIPLYTTDQTVRGEDGIERWWAVYLVPDKNGPGYYVVTVGSPNKDRIEQLVNDGDISWKIGNAFLSDKPYYRLRVDGIDKVYVSYLVPTDNGKYMLYGETDRPVKESVELMIKDVLKANPTNAKGGFSLPPN